MKKSGPKPKPEIALSINAAALAFGVTREVLTRAVKEAEVRGNVPPRQRIKDYTIREIHISLAGDARSARTRLVAAKADQAEHDLKVARREYVPSEEANRFIIDSLVPLREFVVAMPGQLSAQVNPADPEHARATLERWRDDFLKLKEKIFVD